MQQTDASAGKYARINGLDFYYEIHGDGHPLVLIHGGGSTIGTTFSNVLPLLAQHYKVIAVELQAHGHTSDNGKPTSFEQDADDVAALLQQLDIRGAYVFGFSNGGSTALQLAIRHPELAGKLVVLSALVSRDGIDEWFWEMMNSANLSHMPQPLQDAFLAIHNDRAALQIMHDRDADRMRQFTDWNTEDIRKIQAPVLVMGSDQDIIRPEHAVKLFRLLPNAQLVILPGVHGECIGEITTPQNEQAIARTVSLIENFLGK